jgi:succinate dehydrogenase membrane anchor subunit
MNLRTPMKGARGLGDGGDGVHHWWIHRVTAIALLPLSVWFVAGVVSHVVAGYDSAVAWVSEPLVTALLILFIGTAFHHSMLGVQVVVEDYVHQRVARMVVLLANTYLHFLLAAVAIVAVLRIAFGS